MPSESSPTRWIDAAEHMSSLRRHVCTAALAFAMCASCAQSATLERVGVNLAGAEFASGAIPGTPNVNYVWPRPQEFDYFIAKGMNTFRVPFLWERLQPTLEQPFDATYLAALDTTVTAATSRGADIILDPHNYARYRGNVIGGANVSNAQFADLWTRLATRYRDNPRVVFGLMNEPHGMPTEQWASAANAAIAAIRATGAEQLILVPGNAYTGAHSWYSTWYGTPNATVMQTIVDSGDNMAFELHQYFDSDSSGTSPNCITSANAGAAQLVNVTNWLAEHGHRGFLGEFAGADNPNCRAAVENAIAYMNARPQQWLGWTWWAAGPWWGSYMYTLEPTQNYTVDAPQLAWLGLDEVISIFADSFE